MVIKCLLQSDTMYVGSTCSSRTSSEDFKVTTSPTSTNTTQSSNSNASFTFPLAPRVSRNGRSSGTGSSASSNKRAKTKKRHNKEDCDDDSQDLPPIGVFWDIENCQVPRNKSAACVVRRVRECFFEGYREAEFIVVCDVWKESAQLIQELHEAQVNLIHVSSTSKNAADEKLRQSLRRFGETHRFPATVVLISGDINFASDLSDLRYRRKMHTVLIHNVNVSDALRQYANESHSFAALTENLPYHKIQIHIAVDLLISNLPTTIDRNPIKNRLRYLSDNCGGRILEVNTEKGTAVIRFATANVAMRAQRRLNGEDVFGRKIVASSINLPNSAAKTNGRKPGKNSENNIQQPNSSWQSQSSSRGDWRSPLNRTPDPHVNTQICDSSRLCMLPNPVELIIRNLDGSLWNLRAILNNLIKQYIMVYHLTISYEDSKPTAILKVSNQHDAEYVISKMHHRKLGFRRISIAYARMKNADNDELKERIVYLLQESQTKSMPLYMLLNLLEERYLMKVSICEINKLRAVCQIVEDKGERLITLAPEIRASPPVNIQKPQQMHYCCVHCPNGLSDIGAGMPDMFELPCVSITLKDFSAKVNKMLSSHMGTLPLLSFTICYKHEFGEQMPVDIDNGVPLEHLVTCITNVKLKYESAKNMAKYIVWEMSLEPEQELELCKKNNSPLATSISLLRREFVELLKSAEKCQILLSKLVPAYHYHFGRQLRVADYGYTKLDDLLHSPHLTNVVQILGEGCNRVLTLSHSTQVRRFTSDLLRLLKSRISKQVSLDEFPNAYIRVFHKSFSAVEYGVCTVEDLLDEVPESILQITKTECEYIIAMPQRVRTPDEILRTKVFANEVVKLLSHSPNNSMMFEKFIQHYHHHFGHQCKVSDYGFTKLIELFEAIPETVKVEELQNSQRKISLTLDQSVKLLGNRILELISKSNMSYMQLDQLMATYAQEYKTPLNPLVYECSDFNQVINKLSDYVKISYCSTVPLLIPVQTDFQASLSLRIWSLLIHPPYHCDAQKLIFSYFIRFQSAITLSHLEQLPNIMMTRSSNSKYTVFLIPKFVKAAKLYQLLCKKGECIPISSLDSMYQFSYGEKLLKIEENAYEKFLSDYSFLITLTRSNKKTTIALNPKLADLKLPIPIDDGDDVGQSSSHWPLPPTNAIVPYDGGQCSKVAPPKPDTPPSFDNNTGCSAWQKPFFGDEMDFSITLPSPETPKYLGNPYLLISPAKNLLPAYPMGSMISSFTPPKATDLPTPDKLLSKKGLFSDDSADSGVNNSHIVSENEMEVSPLPNLGAIPKVPRKKPDIIFHV